jgi:hypothetical protein
MSDEEIVEATATEVPVEEPVAAAPAPEMSADDAYRILQAKGQENLRKCQEEIGAVLEKFGFQLDIQHTIQIVPKK